MARGQRLCLGDDAFGFTEKNRVGIGSAGIDTEEKMISHESVHSGKTGNPASKDMHEVI
ncbi:hypothetical protein D3C71_2163610 [compost metagenome]